MRRARLSDVTASQASASHFTGNAARRDLLAAEDPPSSAILVEFEPGSRTHWHSHPAGQYLFVMTGTGLAQTRGGPIISIQAGDCLYAAPGEQHWHGASQESSVAHLAFSFGVTQWSEAVASEAASSEPGAPADARQRP